MATFEKQLTDAVWYQCLIQYYIKRESQNWGDLGQYQSELSLAWVMGFDSTSESFYQELNTRLESLGISKLSLKKAEDEHKYFELNIGKESFSVFESERINNTLKSNNSDLVLQVGYYGSEIEGILAKGYVEEFNKIPIYILSEELVYTPNIIPGMVAVINNRQIYVRESALDSIFEKKWVQHFKSVDYPEFSKEETLSKEIRKQVMVHLGAEDRQGLLEQKSTFLTALKELIVYHEFGHAIIQYNVLDPQIATFSESATTLGDNIIIDLLELMADIVDEYDNMMGPLYYLLNTDKHSNKEKSAMFLTYLSDAWFYDTPNTFMYGYSDLVAAIMVYLLGDDMSVNSEEAKQFIKDDLYPWVKQESESIFKEFYSVVSQYPYFEERKAYWDTESEKQYKGQGEYEKNVWSYSQVLVDLIQDPEVQGNLQTYLDSARESFHAKLKKKLSYPKKLSLREGVFDRLTKKLSI